MRTSNWIIRPGRDEIIKIYELPPTSKPFQGLLSSQRPQLHQLITSSHQLTLCPVPYRVLEPPRSLATTVLPFLASRRSSEAPGRKIAGLEASKENPATMIFNTSHSGLYTLQGINISHLGEKENHLQNAIFGGYVRSLESKFLLGPKQLTSEVCGRLKISRLANLTFFTYDTWMVFYLDWTCK